MRKTPVSYGLAAEMALKHCLGTYNADELIQVASKLSN